MKFAALLSLALLAGHALASSHSEAPGIANSPGADNVDLYAFRSYESGREDFVTFIMDVNPLQLNIAGPNYYSLSDDHFFILNIDNDGDAEAEITFEFFAGSQLGGVADTKPFDPNEELCFIPSPVPPPPENIHLGTKVPILNKDGTPNQDMPSQFVPLKFTGPIDSFNDADANWFEIYHLNVVYNGGEQQQVKKSAGGANSEVFQKPMDYAGEKTFGSASAYESYARKFIFEIDIPGCPDTGRVFVGQRVEPFHVNLGKIFDLVNFIPIDGFIRNDQCNNDLRYVNVDSFVLEVPIACVTGSSDVIGVWTTVTELCHVGANHVPGKQVSRLGQPLVNELVIGIAAKEAFNEGSPSGDAQFANFVTHPSFPSILDILFRKDINDALNSAFPNIAPSNLPRGDLVAVFLTGLKGLNQPPEIDFKASEMLRLNTSVAAKSRANQNEYGVIGGDNAGFPNGRRPGDDAVDIILRVAMGRLCYLDNNPWCTPSDAPVGDLDFSDGAPVNARDFDDSFPYLRTPVTGSPFPGFACAAAHVAASVVALAAGLAAVLSL